MSCEEFRDGIRDWLRTGGSAAASAHRAGCPDCAAAWERERALSEALEGLADRERLAAPGPRVEAAVMDAFRARRRRPAVRPGVRWAMAAAGIAAAAGLVWLGAWSQRRDAEPAAVRVDPFHGFYAVGTGPMFEPGEYAPVIRLRLPQRELSRFGVPLTPLTADGVDVDVVVGRDGMAKAVRLVNTEIRELERRSQ